MTNNIDFVSAIHCGHSEAKLTRSNSDAPFKSIRRVRFPEDDKLISDYLEPFRLIPDNCSSEELQAAYFSSCFEHRITPINFLLEQIKGIDLSICNERYSRLSLRGIRLNRFHIESMEAIFQRAHFRVIDLENTFLDEQSASSLFDMLLHYESCTDLSISLNLNKTLPSQAWSRCVNFMRKSSALRRFTLSHTPLRLENFHGLNFYGLCLERLNFIDCNLTGQSLYGLMQWLYILLSSTSLYPPTRDRSYNSSRGHKFRGWRHRRHTYTTSALLLSSNTSTTNTTNNTNTTTNNNTKHSIWELRLGLMNNKLTSSDVEAILPLIRHHLFIPNISGSETVKFEGHKNNNNSNSNNDTNESSSSDALVNNSSHTKSTQLKKSNSLSSSLCDFLPVGGIGYLLELNLSHNNIGDDGLGILCTGLLQSYRNRLRERFSTLDDQEVLKLTAMSSPPSTEKKSDSNSNPCCTPPIPMKICSLEHLYLVDNNLGIDGMQSLAIVLMQTPKSLISLVGGLIILDLSNNVNIGDKGVEVLCEGLIRNYSLKELYLRSINMSFSGIFALSSFLSESKCLKYLDIRNNNLDIASIMALSKTLFINRTLTSLVSDAHRWANSQPDLSDKDKDLIKSLIESIDSNLRRNRLETELVDNINNNVSNNNCDTITPTGVVNEENSLGQSEFMNISSVMQCNDNSLTNCSIMNGEMSLDITNGTSDTSVIRSYECNNNNDCDPDNNNSNADLQLDSLLKTTTTQLDIDSNVEILGNFNCTTISTNPVHETSTAYLSDKESINKDDKFINKNENYAIMEKRSKEEEKTTIMVVEQQQPLLQHISGSFMSIGNLSSCSSNLFENVNIPSTKDDKSLNYDTKSNPIQSSVNVFDKSNSLNTIEQNNHINNDAISN
ncbi:putative leucine rich repeat-containing [Schistosoma mansoni]|uniref:Putative leucine rich repeat-containing n=1 Tax=Schistosoma mansoni TaxID=6183 RepID=G4V9Z8_SCHMA|nr:putative leucine rich repeat-containing [Schistosoma mansoni]|eukprot:XP_018649247.1 putative leucine rich repeat-containing [Schistosoma mansoni]